MMPQHFLNFPQILYCRHMADITVFDCEMD